VVDAFNVDRPNHYLRVLKGGRLRILIPFARYALQSIERGLGAEQMHDHIFTFVIYIPINSQLHKVKTEYILFTEIRTLPIDSRVCIGPIVLWAMDQI
jgi:hypothetical protein